MTDIVITVYQQGLALAFLLGCVFGASILYVFSLELFCSKWIEEQDND